MASESVRFQKVLHIREIQRDITKTELAEKEKAAESIARRIDEIQEKKQGALDAFSAPRNEPCSPQALWFERQHLDHIETNLEKQKGDLKQTQESIEVTKSCLVEQHKDCSLMEKFIEKIETQRRAALLAREQNGLDEISSLRFSRRIGGGNPS